MVWTDYTGKPAGTLRVTDDYTPLDARTDDPPSSGLEFHMLYANCALTWLATSAPGIIRVRYVRDGGDATAYQDYTLSRDQFAGTFNLTAQHWEAGEKGIGGIWELRCGGGIHYMDVGTRYAKIGVVS